MSRVAIAVAVALVVLAAEAAFGHAWFRKNRDGDEIHLAERAPTPEEVAAGVTAVYGVTVVEGRKQKVYIEDLADCTARIPVESVSGGAAIVRGTEPGTAFVKTQVIEIRGVEPGEAIATIPVTGDVSKGCAENSKNLLVIRVVPDGERADAAFGAEWKRRGKLVRSAIRQVGQAARAQILDVGAAIRGGATDPEAGMAQVYALAHSALVENRRIAWTDVAVFRTDVVNALSAGGFTPGELPNGVAAGTGGSWDLAYGGAKFEVRLGAEYLGDTLSKLQAGFDKAGTKPVDGGVAFFYTVHDQGLPGAHSPALGSTLPDPAAKLAVDISGGYTIPHDMGDPEGYFFVGGTYDTARGAPIGSIIRPGAASLPVTITTGASGTWSGTAEDLAPGFPYAFRLSYAGGENECDFPFFIPNLHQF